jgi:hypothetical protein
MVRAKKKRSKVQYYYSETRESGGARPKGIHSGKAAREHLREKRSEQRRKHLEETGRTANWFPHEDGSWVYESRGKPKWGEFVAGGERHVKPKKERMPEGEPREKKHNFLVKLRDPTMNMAGGVEGAETLSEEERKRIEDIAMQKLLRQVEKYEKFEKSIPSLRKPKFIIRYTPESIPAPLRPVR